MSGGERCVWLCESCAQASLGEQIGPGALGNRHCAWCDAYTPRPVRVRYTNAVDAYRDAIKSTVKVPS